MAKLAVFGDSWPYGCDLHPGEKPFGQLLADKLSYEYVLCARPETSIEHMVLQLSEFVKHMGTDTAHKALFCLTEPSRSLYFAPEPATTSVMWDGPKQGDTVSQAYYKYVHSDKLDYFRLNQSITVLQKICKDYNIADYYVTSFSKVTWEQLDVVGMDRTKFFDNGNSTFLDFFGCRYVDPENRYFLGSATAHPNQLGHELIAERLIEWIS